MSLKKLWHRAVNRAYDDSYELARVGKHNPDTSTTLAVVGLADYLWVTLADQTTVQARNDAGVPQTIDLEVWVRAETNAGGGAPTYVIEGRSAAGLLSAPTTTPPSGVLAHATTHQHGGTDEIATATPAANAIPKADGSGLLDAWVTPPPVTSVNTQTGAVVLDADDIDDAATTNKFATAAELSKLAGIEAGADVTDAGNVGSAIDGATAKTTPVDADTMPLIDSADSNALKKVTWANIKATIATYYNSLAATLTNKTLDSTNISTLTAKNPPVDADSAVIVDSAASNVFKRVTYTNVKAFLKTYFDTLYVALTGNQTVAGIKTFTDRMALAVTTTTGAALSVVRDLAAASTDSPVVTIHQDNAGDDQVALYVRQDASTLAAKFESLAGQADLQMITSASADWAGVENETDASRLFFRAYGSTQSGTRFGQARASSTEFLHVSGSRFQLGTLISAPMIFGTNNTFAVIIDASQRVGIGVTTIGASKLGIQAGTSTNDAAVGGDLYVDSTSRVNSGTGETDLASYTVPANTLSANNMYLEVNAHIRFEGVAGTKTIKFHFGTDNFTVHATTDTGTDIRIFIRIYRTGAAAQKITLFVATQAGNSISVNTFTRTLSSSNVLKFTGQATGGSNSITQHTMDVIYHDANV